MTNDEMRIEIAQVLGWKHVREINYILIGQPPEHLLHPDNINKGKRDTEWPVPNCPEDLNACHEMEEWLLAKHKEQLKSGIRPVTGPTTGILMAELSVICQRDHDANSTIVPDWHGTFQYTHATAQQRCIAF